MADLSKVQGDKFPGAIIGKWYGWKRDQYTPTEGKYVGKTFEFVKVLLVSEDVGLYSRPLQIDVDEEFMKDVDLEKNTTGYQGQKVKVTGVFCSSFGKLKFYAQSVELTKK